MPIMYVNPAPRRRVKIKRVVDKRSGRTIATFDKGGRWRLVPHKRKSSTAKVVIVKSPGAKRRRKDKGMKKLYGAAAKAHAKRLAKLHKRKKARKNPSKRRRRRARRNPVARLHRRRRVKRNPAKRRRRHVRRNPSARRSRRRYRRNPELTSMQMLTAPGKKRGKSRKGRKGKKRKAARRPRRAYGVKTLKRARRAIKRARRRGGLAGHYAKVHHMRSNPSRRRRRRRHHSRRHARRHYRRNPSGMIGALMDAVKAAIPVAASFYGTKALVNFLAGAPVTTAVAAAAVAPAAVPVATSGMIPGLDSLGSFAKPALAVGVLAAAHYGTKKVAFLNKHRGGIMLGASLALVDSLVSAFAPANVKTMFGLSGGLYDGALGEYRSMGEYRAMSDYIGVNGTPINDDISLSDYLDVSGVSEAMGALQEELGVEEDLGALMQELGDDSCGTSTTMSTLQPSPQALLGGVSSVAPSMLKQIPSASFSAPVPNRSFTKTVQNAGSNYDSNASTYRGIFSGGF